MAAALPQVIVKTVFVHDTTVVRDTVFHYLGRTPIPFPVQVHDPFSWWRPITAAFIGALIGGLLSMLATRIAISREWKLEQKDRLHRLVSRVKSNLERIQRLSDRVREHPIEDPFPPDVGDELEVTWNTYYRVADPIFSLGDDDLSERVDAFFQEVRKTGLLVRDIEARPLDEPLPPSWVAGRDELIAAIIKLGEHAGVLMSSAKFR